MIEKLYQAYLKSTSVSTDTRTIQQGNIWFALKGPNFNANKFADLAIDKGASYVVIDDKDFVKDDRYLLVPDVLTALQQLANYHRNKLAIPFLAITGSNGKTTTKELIRDVLSKKYKVLATTGNLNNHIGVPLTLLEIDDTIEFAVIEMGANAQNEIKALCEIAQPNYGVITNIGKAHLEGFGGLEGVFKGKTEMYDFLANSNGQAFVNTNFPRLVEKLESMKIPFRRYPNDSDDLKLKLLGEKPELEIEVQGRVFTTMITGGYNAANIAAALCIGEFFGVALDDAIEAVSSYDPDNNRSQLIQIGSNRIVLDAYNANPSSMQVALSSFESREAKKRVIILGDMRELGEASESEHEQLGKLTSNIEDAEIHFCGKEIALAQKGNQDARYWDKKEKLAAYLEEKSFEETLFLIKGSRGMALETLLKSL